MMMHSHSVSRPFSFFGNTFTRVSPTEEDRRTILFLKRALHDLLQKNNDISSEVSEDVCQNMAALKMCIARAMQSPADMQAMIVLLNTIDGELGHMISQLQSLSEELYTSERHLQNL